MHNSTFTHEFTASVREDAVAVPTVTLRGVDGETISSFEMEPYESEYFLTENTPGYIDKAYNFTMNNMDVLKEHPATITFTFDTSLMDVKDFEPTIYYWNDEEQYLERLDNQTVNGNTVTADVTHFSTYVLLNGTLVRSIMKDDNGKTVTKSMFKNGGKDYDKDGLNNNKELL